MSAGVLPRTPEERTARQELILTVHQGTLDAIKEYRQAARSVWLSIFDTDTEDIIQGLGVINTGE